MSTIDDVPSYPPGPRGPEDPEPGAQLTMGPDQLAWIARLVEKTPEVSSVSVEDRGAGYFRVCLEDREQQVIVERVVFPIIGQFTEP